jgi:hypothetical protein
MTNQPRRRSLYVRTGELPPLHLTERDKKILKLVADLRSATGDQIHRLVFAPATIRTCNRRLQKLWLHHLLDRVFVPVVFCQDHPQTENPRFYYQLTGKGAKVSFGANSRGSFWPTPPNPYHLVHQYEVNEFRAALTEGLAKRLGTESRLLWISEARIREANHLAKQKHPNLARKLVLPDALFSFVVLDGQREFFFLEIDRGTESVWRIVQRAKAYIYLHHSDLKRTVHQIPNFRVLIVTKSFDRLMHLRAAIANLGQCLNMFWFTTFEENGQAGNRLRQAPGARTSIKNIAAERILEPIWHKITDSGEHSITGALKQANGLGEEDNNKDV